MELFSKWTLHTITNAVGLLAILGCVGHISAYFYPHHDEPHEKLKSFFLSARIMLTTVVILLLLYNFLLFVEKENKEKELLANNQRVQQLLSDSLNLTDKFNVYVLETQEKLQISVDSIRSIDTAIEQNVITSIDILDKEVNRCQKTVTLLRQNVDALDSMPALNYTEKTVLKQNYELAEHNTTITKKSLIAVARNLHNVLLRARDLEVQNADRLLANTEQKYRLLLSKDL